jgi:hypothetical protein
MLDDIEKRHFDDIEHIKKQNLDDIKTAINVVDHEIGRLEGYIDKLRDRIEVLEGKGDR